ncbi:hypothetical protein GCM10009592_28420 [Brachybacterium rhamnosum]|uniref:Uncharacterized protein n=1 Tax=Brachybacterium rhamnosum TaxID=173361 RepID=A0ABW4Q379_9MICO
MTTDAFTISEAVIRAEWIGAMTTPAPDEAWEGITEAEASARWDSFIRKVKTDAARTAWNEGRDALALAIAGPADENGMRRSPTNPYTSRISDGGDQA